MTSAAPVRAQEGRRGVIGCRVERHLRLNAGDAVYRKPVLALEILDLRRELGVELFVVGLIGGQAVDASQAVAQPAHSRTAGSEAERLRASGSRRPKQHIVSKPGAGQIADANCALRTAEIDARLLLVDTDEHELVRLAGRIDDV